MLHIKVNATSANLCVGFDTLGLALDLANDFYFEPADKFYYEGFDLEYANDNNLLKTSYEYVFKLLNKRIIPLKMKIISKIPISRGLGSSSTLIVAGIMAANYYLNNPLSKDECLRIATIIEGHPDNVAPAIFGGLVSSFKVGDDIKYVKYDVSNTLKFMTISPKEMLETKKAREVLPQSYQRADVINNLSRITNIPYAFKNGDLNLINDLFNDKIHEPYRMNLIKNSYAFKDIAKKQNLAFCISGSGSTMLVIYNDKINIDEFKIDDSAINLLNVGKEAEITNE